MFTDPSEGRSTIVKFLRNWCDTDFLGVAFCVVIEFNECELDGNFELSCQSTCTFSSGKSVDWRRSWTWHWIHSDHEGTENTIKLAHTFLFYDYTCHEYFRYEATNTTQQNTDCFATFEFRPKDSSGFLDSCNCQVIGCGIRLLYKEDSQRYGFINQNHVEEEDSSSTSSCRNIEQTEVTIAQIDAIRNTQPPGPSGTTGADVRLNMTEQQGPKNSPCSQIKG